MSLSDVCIEQRARETRQLKFFIAFSLMGSALLHGACLALSATVPWQQALEPEVEPIELTMIEPTELEDKPEKKPEKEEQTEIEVTSGVSAVGSVLSGVGAGRAPPSPPCAYRAPRVHLPIPCQASTPPPLRTSS